MLIDMLFFLITATAHWHAKHHHAQQAAAAHQAAEHLRSAYQTAAPPPIAALHRRGRRLPQALRQQQTASLRRALPELVDRILAEPGWQALAATLADAETAGYNPAALLADATRRRELDTADSVSDVMVWRLRRIADPSADAEQTPVHKAAPTPSRTLLGPQLKGGSDSSRQRR